MNKTAILTLLGAGLIIGGAGLGIGLLGDTGNTPDGGTATLDGQAQPVKPDIPFAQTKVDNLRLAYKPGTCPANVTVPRVGKAEAKGRGPMECGAMIPGNGYCVCWTQQAVGEADEEIHNANQLPAADRKRGVICCPKDPKIDVPEVHWEKDIGTVPDGCHVFARPINDVVVQGVDTDLDAQARLNCAPCSVPGGGDWGQCPQCMCAPGGCAAVCPGP